MLKKFEFINFKISKLNLNLEVTFAFLSFFLYSIYLFSWNWGFFPITEGFFLVAGKAILNGSIPYVDFYAYLPPAYYWLCTIIMYFDETGIQLGRTIGFCLMLFFYPIVNGLFNLWFETKLMNHVITFFSLLILSSSTAFLSYDFTQFVIFFSLAGWLFINSENYLKLFLGGVFIALAVLFKQSNGAAVALIAIFFVLFSNLKEIKKFLIFCLGGLLTTLLIFMPIILLSIFPEVISSILFEASNNKGGFHSLYFWFTKGFYSITNLKNLIFIVITIFITLIVIKIVETNLKERIRNNSFYLFLNLIFFSLVIFFNFESDINFLENFFWKDIFLISGYIGFFTLFLYLIFRVLSISLNHINLSSSLLNISLILGSGMSGGLTKTSIFFSVGYILLLIINFLRKNVILYSTIIVIIISVIIPIIDKKYKTPYLWWNYNAGSAEKFLLNVSKNNNYVDVEKIKKFFDKCSVKPKNLLNFPHMTALNLITKIDHYNKTTIFWFDYLSDNHAKETYDLLLRDEPDSYIIWHPPENVFTAHSNLFKFGKKLIHEDIYNLLNSLSYQKDYTKKYFKIGKTRIEIFTKKNLNC